MSLVRPRSDPPEGPAVTRRGLVLLGAQVAFGGVLAWRMRQLQVVESARYRLLAEENRIKLELLATPRAQLFDRNGEPLAINIENYRVLMIREQAGDAEAMLERLGLLIDIPPHQRERILKEFRQKPAFVPIGVAEHLSWADFAEINANAPALPGIQPEAGLTRLYPHGPETAHVVGYVGRVSQRDIDRIKDKGEELDPVLQLPEFQIGKTGIERALEQDLRGRAGTRQVEVNARGRIIRELDRHEGQLGQDLHLTLDLRMQKYCHERLGDESAAVVLMDPRNGDLLAMASNPTFDPNPFILGISHDDFNALRDNDHRPLHNKWASGMYPPGSTFKMVVALAALEAGVIGPGSTHYCPGHLQLGKRRFHCWRRGGHGWVDLRKSLEQSCDVYYYEVARQVGIEKIGEMARRPGPGRRSGPAGGRPEGRADPDQVLETARAQDRLADRRHAERRDRAGLRAGHTPAAGGNDLTDRLRHGRETAPDPRARRPAGADRAAGGDRHQPRTFPPGPAWNVLGRQLAPRHGARVAHQGRYLADGRQDRDQPGPLQGRAQRGRPLGGARPRALRRLRAAR